MQDFKFPETNELMFLESTKDDLEYDIEHCNDGVLSGFLIGALEQIKLAIEHVKRQKIIDAMKETIN